MAEQPENERNPMPTMEQRMEKLEGNFELIMNLLKELTSNKENDNSSNNNSNPATQDNDANTEGGSPIQTNGENSAKIVINIPKQDQGGSSSHNNRTPGQDDKIKEEETIMLSKMEMLEEKVRAIQGMEAYGKLDMRDFCLFPDIEIPTKFKVPDFEKFEGKIDPIVHLTMYTRSMAAYCCNRDRDGTAKERKLKWSRRQVLFNLGKMLEKTFYLENGL